MNLALEDRKVQFFHFVFEFTEEVDNVRVGSNQHDHTVTNGEDETIFQRLDGATLRVFPHFKPAEFKVF